MTRKVRSLLGLLLFVFGTLGAPSLDAVLFDHHGHDPVAHVEASGDDAHAERCVLGTLAAPVTPADPPVACGRFEAVIVPTSERAPALPLATRTARSALGPRAPPARA